MGGRGCVSRLDYVRYALVEGLREAERIGVNPYTFGLIGSTDTHAATPGAVAEPGFQRPGSPRAGRRGRGGVPPRFLAGAHGQGPERSAGGLAGVWAEENSRDAIFDALARREAFATSGPRIAPRFFAGWDLPADLCERDDLVARGYAGGVPMGGTLAGPSPAGASPRFAAEAHRDPEGAPLQRLQIVKAWHGADGAFHQAVHDVARVPDGASVDLDTCALRGPGAETLCATWTDPDFDPARAAVYYARVVENPSCRWTTWKCLALPAEKRPPACTDARVPRTLQERAWTSPIWVLPAP
jgi:hypothetical protein